MILRLFLATLALGALVSSAEAHHRHHYGRHHHHAHAWRVEAAQIVAHPAGCPSRAFCGCGAAVRVFGHSVRSLWLAASWFRFPRTMPAPGMVAVRRHHVFVLEQAIAGDIWRVFDANSGHHLTRIHARSIAGFVIVNPNG